MRLPIIAANELASIFCTAVLVAQEVAGNDQYLEVMIRDPKRFQQAHPEYQEELK